MGDVHDVLYNKNKQNIGLVSDNEVYFVIYRYYHVALEKFEKVLDQYDWMKSYIDRVAGEKGNKIFVYGGGADEIKRMMDDIKSKQEQIYQLLSRK